MSAVSKFDYDGYSILGNKFSISAATSIPANSRIVCTSGQIADAPLDPSFAYAPTHTEQFEIAMANIEKSLQAASPTLSRQELWGGVFNMTSFHVGVVSLEEQQRIAAVAKKYFGEIGGNKPAWAAIGVMSLFPEKALVEIQVQAAYKEV